MCNTLIKLILSHKKEFLIITTVVIIIQLFSAIPVFQNINRALLPIANAIQYDRLAHNIIEHHTLKHSANLINSMKGE